jgi:hypothetical protein
LVGVLVDVCVGVSVATGVFVGVAVGVSVATGVFVAVVVGVSVARGVLVSVLVGVGVGVLVGVSTLKLSDFTHSRLFPPGNTGVVHTITLYSPFGDVPNGCVTHPEKLPLESVTGQVYGPPNTVFSLVSVTYA